MLKLEIHFIENYGLNSDNISRIKKSDIVVRIVEEYQRVRVKYLFEIFFRNELPNWDSHQRRNTQEY